MNGNNKKFKKDNSNINLQETIAKAKQQQQNAPCCILRPSTVLVTCHATVSHCEVPNHGLPLAALRATENGGMAIVGVNMWPQMGF